LIEADYVVVGAGSAGCVLADRLSANGRHRVLLLEAGPRDRSIWIHLPIGYGKTMFHPVYNWGFYTDPEPGMNDRRIYWPRGRGLGGSSSINGLIYVRGQPEDYDQWAALGNRGWGWKDVLPYFERSEMSCSPIDDKHELIEAIIRGANELGIPANDDFNDGRQEGVGYYELFTRNGLRSSSATAYLRRAERRPNLKVEIEAHATRVLLEGARAVGVRYRQGGAEKEVRAAREVILSAGALQSPQLLQLSGVGPADLLQSLGIPVVTDLPGVGENLQDHLQLRVMYKCTKPITTNDDLRGLWGKARIGAKWLFTRTGPLAIGINQGGLFTRVLPESSTPDVQFHFATLSAELAGAKPHPWSGFTMSVCQLRPESRGSVRIRSRDPLEPPAIQANYLSTELDRRCAVAGVKLARALAATQSLRPYVAAEYRPGAQAQTEADLLEFARNHGATIFHPVGTCKMGRDPMAVVDDELRVRGIAGLRVVDCSVMPTLVSGNTHAPAVMIAEKASDLIFAGDQRAATKVFTTRCSEIPSPVVKPS
jgi:choline dehydrogenase